MPPLRSAIQPQAITFNHTQPLPQRSEEMERGNVFVCKYAVANVKWWWWLRWQLGVRWW